MSGDTMTMPTMTMPMMDAHAAMPSQARCCDLGSGDDGLAPGASSCSHTTLVCLHPLPLQHREVAAEDQERHPAAA